MKQLVAWIFSLILSGLAFGADSGATKQDKPTDGFKERVDAMFQAEAGQPLKRAKKQPPLRPGSGNCARAYSYSIVGYAARCLYLGEMLDEANADYDKGIVTIQKGD
jgi:hypothetical protein